MKRKDRNQVTTLTERKEKISVIRRCGSFKNLTVHAEVLERANHSLEFSNINGMFKRKAFNQILCLTNDKVPDCKGENPVQKLQRGLFSKDPTEKKFNYLFGTFHSLRIRMLTSDYLKVESRPFFKICHRNRDDSKFKYFRMNVTWKSGARKVILRQK